MRLKGIGALALALLAAVPARALEERIVLSPGQQARRESAFALVPSGSPGAAASFGTWLSDGARLRPGFRGGPEYALSHAEYRPTEDTDLLLHFDEAGFRDEAGRWSLSLGPAYAIDTERAILGRGAASFRGPDSSINLDPGPRALFARDARFRDFSIEFWLYPANGENGEVILMWQSVRKTASGILPQQISCVVAGGRILWSFVNFFSPPEGDSTRGTPAETRMELKAKTPLVPHIWSQHLIRFDADSGLLEYLVDGIPEAIVYASSTGREGDIGKTGQALRGTVFTPAIGAAAPFHLAPDYSGLIDEFRLSSSFIERPNLKPYGRDPALILSPIADLGFGHSRLLAIDAEYRTPGASGLELSFRIADAAAGWKLDEPGWIPVRPGQELPESTRGRYVQVRVELFPDGSGLLTPALSSIVLRYEPDPPPPPPARVIAVPKDGAIELRWTRVPESDLAGYLVYYGDAPGEYFGTGAAQGPSPVDAGLTLSLTLSGLPNGRLLYIAVAAYDDAGLPGASDSSPGSAGKYAKGATPTTRAGEFSQEISARPSRTAP